jgi:3-oxoacyl-[acyl-carrier-protein] synthase-1
MIAWLGRPGLLCALGNDAESVRTGLLAGDSGGMAASTEWLANRSLHVGQVRGTAAGLAPCITAEMPSHYDTRNNRLLFAAARQIDAQVTLALARYGAARIAVVVGTSTSGVNDNVPAFVHRQQVDDWPPAYDYRRQALFSPAEFLARRLGIHGPAYTLSTACTSSARALLSARRLLQLGVCDAVICGGADTLCRLTISGFASLEALSPGPCKPFSAHRDGINIGEAAALFVMTREALKDEGIALLGGGASSDAWHMSAPEPGGAGAAAAMRGALRDAALGADAIGWLNLHGTATVHNDAMESLAVAQCFAQGIACASTKALTGHALGAAGALEAALCWLALTAADDRLPPHVWDGVADPALPALDFSTSSHRWPTDRPRLAMSNSFAFGGNNTSLILGEIG